MNSNGILQIPTMWQLSAVSVALAVMLASGLSLLAVWALRRRPAPARYGLLLSALALCLAAPGLSQLGRLSGVGQVRVTLPPPAPPILVPIASVDVPPLTLPAEMPQTVATRPPAQTKPRFVFSWAVAGGILMALWALGILAGLARMALGASMVLMLLRSSRPADSAASRAAAERARLALGLGAAPRLRESPMTPMPLVVGLFRPVILLPSGLAERLDAGQLDAVLLHETAHVAHRDPLIGFAQRLAGTLFWWCPLLHQVNRRLNELREYICDNYVIRTQGDGFRLARVLVDLAEQTKSGRWLRLAGAMAVTEPGGARLEARVRRLLRGDCNTVTRMNLAAILATVAFALLVGCTMVGTAVRTGEEQKGGAADTPRIRVTKPSATEYTVETTMNMAKLTLLPGKWGTMTISSQDHIQWVFEAMVKPVDGEGVELSYRLSQAKPKGIREWQERERRVPLGQWVKMQAETAGPFAGVKEILVRPGALTPQEQQRTGALITSAKINELLATIKVEMPKKPCACIHQDSAVFVKDEGKIKVLFCEHCFDFDGKFYAMPAEFYALSRQAAAANPDGWPEGMEKTAIRFIRMQYDGPGWDDGMDAASRTDVNLLAKLGEWTGFKVSERAESHRIKLLSKYPKDYAPPFVYMTGSGEIGVNGDEVETLRNYLTGGGMLIADCGSKEWDASFRALAAKLFPEAPLTPIPDDDVLFRSPFALTNGAPPLLRHGGSRCLGIKFQKRWAVFYHPGGMKDAWKTGHSGLTEKAADDAFKLGVNLVRYACAAVLAQRQTSAPSAANANEINEAGIGAAQSATAQPAARREAWVLVPFLAQAPICDGLFSAGEWDAAATTTASGSATGTSVRTAQPQLRIHLGYDNANLYVACYIPTCPPLSRVREFMERERNAKDESGKVVAMRDDYIRVELWPGAEPSAGMKYGSFIVQWNEIGEFSDWYLDPADGADWKWWSRSELRAVGQANDASASWVSEWAIPLKSLRYGKYAATNAEGTAALTVPPQDASTWRLRFVSKVGDASNDLAAAAFFGSEADFIFRQANELFREKQFREAGALFEQAQQKFPYHPMAPKALVIAAQCRMRLQDWKGAMQVLSRFDSAYPRRVEDWTGATHQPAIQAARAYAEAEKVRPEVRYWLGDCHAKTGDDRQAYRTWKRLTWDYPEAPWAKYARARLTEAKFQAFKGEDSAAETTNAVPNTVTKRDDSISTRDAVSVPAVREDKTRQPGETDADALLREARELQETADWAMRLNRPPIPLADLLAACRKVTERYPNTEASRKAMLDMAELQSKWGDKEQAVKSYQELAEKLANTPEGGIASAKVVDACIEKQAYAKALEIIEKAVVDPKAPGRDTMLMKGVLAAFKTEDYAKSRTMAEQLVQDHPESEHARTASVILPKIYSNLGLPSGTQPPKPEPRKESFAPAIGIHTPGTEGFFTPAGPTAVEDLAAAKDFLAKGDVVQAARHFDRIVNAKADPKIRAEALWQMAEIYRSCGNVEQAYRAYKILCWDYPETAWAGKVPNRLVEKELRDLEKRGNGE